jgi:hypothetical protein
MAVIYCHCKVNYPNIFFKVFHNIEKIITAVINYRGKLFDNTGSSGVCLIELRQRLNLKVKLRNAKISN